MADLIIPDLRQFSHGKKSHLLLKSILEMPVPSRSRQLLPR
jgi:hypothetical protein